LKEIAQWYRIRRRDLEVKVSQFSNLSQAIEVPRHDTDSIDIQARGLTKRELHGESSDTESTLYEDTELLPESSQHLEEELPLTPWSLISQALESNALEIVIFS
jgi:hypothetical protein